MTHLKLASLATSILVMFIAAPALAQTAAELQATMTIDAAITPPPLPVRPLDVIKARARQVQQNAQDARIELRQETRADFQTATTPGAKLDVVRNAVQDRVQIARDRIASTTGMRLQVRAAIRQHAGLIKQRFSLALRHFDNLLGRIESRVEKLKAGGAATASIEADLALAKTANATAKVDVQAVTDFVASVTDESDRTAVKAELEAKIKTAHASIKAAHQAIMKTVRSLVALAKPKMNVQIEASGSAETSVE